MSFFNAEFDSKGALKQGTVPPIPILCGPGEHRIAWAVHEFEINELTFQITIPHDIANVITELKFFDGAQAISVTPVATPFGPTYVVPKGNHKRLDIQVTLEAPSQRNGLFEGRLVGDGSDVSPPPRIGLKPDDKGVEIVLFQILVSTPNTSVGPSQPITLERSRQFPTEDLPLWIVIRRSTDAASFENYQLFVNLLLCGGDEELVGKFKSLATRDQEVFFEFTRRYGKNRKRRFLPFNDTDAYRHLKVATEAFILSAASPALGRAEFDNIDAVNLLASNGISVDEVQLNLFWKAYLKAVNGDPSLALPYLSAVAQRFDDIDVKDAIFSGFGATFGNQPPPDLQSLIGTRKLDDAGGYSEGGEFAERLRNGVGYPGDPDFRAPAPLATRCYGVLRDKLTRPLMMELIWSYWHEEGMQAQTMIALRNRFQNIRNPGPFDPLSTMELDPLRPLNNILWGYIQDEQHRLTIMRRNYEYDHHYGFGLQGTAVPPLRSADSRSKFLEAFHNLLYLSTTFFKNDDDTTVHADGFPVLNALKEVHFLLAEGAHNQFGDLPSTSRQEMLIEQWILARPEFRDFLPARSMVAYSEPWMANVDAMKNLQGWTSTSVMYFHDLGKFGEQLLLSIRYGAWSFVDDPQNAANWARFWRAEIQGYLHAYRTVTGVDLTIEASDTQQGRLRNMPPSSHLTRRWIEQRSRGSRNLERGFASSPAARITQR